jgi:ABC-2 type transport system ATP-binding protein
MEVVFQDVIKQVRDAGKTVLLSSHILDQVEKLCDRVSIIRQGKVVESGSLLELRHLTRTTIEADTVQPPTGLEALPGVHDVTVRDHRVRMSVDGDHLDATVRYLSTLGVSTLVSQPPTLEELMLRHYGDELASNGLEPAMEQR